MQKSLGIIEAMCEEGAGHHTFEPASRMLLGHLEILELSLEHPRLDGLDNQIRLDALCDLIRSANKNCGKRHPNWSC